MSLSTNDTNPNRKSTFWYLENFNLFKYLQPAAKIELEKLAIVEQKVKNSIIYFPEVNSNTLYLIKTGKIKISRLAPQGQETTMDILESGEIFGELALAGPNNCQEIGEVVEDALIYSFRTVDFENFLHRHPELNLQVLKLIDLRLEKVQVRLKNLLFKNAAERILYFIKELAVKQGQPLTNDKGIIIKLSLTQVNIAKLTATNRHKVTMVLNELEKRGLIKYNQERLYLKNLQLLESTSIQL